MTILAAITGEQVPSTTLLEAIELGGRFDEDVVALHVMTDETFEELQGDTGGSTIPFAPGVSYGELDRSSESGQPQYTIEDGEVDAETLARDVVKATLDDWDDVVCRGRVGDPVKEVLDEARRTDARYLVVGGRKRSAVGKAVFGSTTQSLLLSADRPVLVVMRE